MNSFNFQDIFIVKVDFQKVEKIRTSNGTMTTFENNVVFNCIKSSRTIGQVKLLKKNRFLKPRLWIIGNSLEYRKNQNLNPYPLETLDDLKRFL